MDGSWYVLRVIVGSEAKVVGELRGWSGFDAFCPWMLESRLQRGRMTEARRPLWPSYVFVSWPRLDADRSWLRVVGTDGEGGRFGIWGIIGGANPTRVPAQVVDGWVARANTDGVIVDLAEKLDELRRGYGKGSEVRLVGGAWDGKTGICQWVNERGVSIRVDLLGRAVSVYLPLVGGATKVVPAGATPINSAAEYETRARRRRRRMIGKLIKAAAV